MSADESLTEESLKETFLKLKTEESKSMVQFDIDRLWNSLRTPAKREANLRKFIELGGHKMLEELLLGDDMAVIKVCLDILNEMMYYTFTDEPWEYYAGEQKCVERFADLLGKLGDVPLEYGNFKLQLVALNTAIGLTVRACRNRKNFIEKTVPVLVSVHLPETSDALYRTQACLLLCNIIGDSEDPEHVKLIQTYQSLVDNVVPSLGNEHTRDNTKCYQVKELVVALINLSRVDTHRQFLLNCGIVDSVLEVLRNTKLMSDSWEVCKVLQLLVNLSFDETTAEEFVRKGVLQLLDMRLDFHGDDADVKDHVYRARWLLQHVPPAEYLELPEACCEHVLISYSRAQQELAQKLADALKQRNVNLWLKSEHENGNSLPSVLRAVDNASVVVLCASNEYRRCINCRVEADYASRCKKSIVAVAAQSDVRVSNWMTSLVGAEIVAGDLSKPEQFDLTLQRLHETVNKHVLLFKRTASNWRTLRVGKWLRENGFGDVAGAFVDEEMDGEALQELAKADLQFFESQVRTLGVRKAGRVLKLHAKLSQLFACSKSKNCEV